MYNKSMAIENFDLERIFNRGIKIGSLHNERDRMQAAQIVRGGGLIGVYNRGVNAIWVDGENELAVRKISKIKGEGRNNKPMALTLGFDELVPMIDTTNLPDEVREFVALSESLKSYIGSLCFLRAPLKEESISYVPKTSVSRDSNITWIQSWDPHGHDPTEQLIEQMKRLGVQFPAVTSMNISGQPEIVDQAIAQKFCIDKKVPMYLKDEYSHPGVLGSYTILTLEDKGIEITRDGNIPASILESILDKKFITNKNTKASKFPQISVPEGLFNGLSSIHKRLALLLYLEGKEPREIIETFRKHEPNRSNIQYS